jgi:hypothetical protein
MLLIGHFSTVLRYNHHFVSWFWFIEMKTFNNTQSDRVVFSTAFQNLWNGWRSLLWLSIILRILLLMIGNVVYSLGVRMDLSKRLKCYWMKAIQSSLKIPRTGLILFIFSHQWMIGKRQPLAVWIERTVVPFLQWGICRIETNGRRNRGSRDRSRGTHSSSSQ